MGYNRYQKNIMGMWLANELQKELCSGLGFAEIVNACKGEPLRCPHRRQRPGISGSQEYEGRL